MINAAMLLGVFVFASCTAAMADSVTLLPVADNTMYEDVGGGLSNGAGEYVFAGGTLRSGLRRRALIRFDLTAIPASATVNSVTLSMNVSRNNAGAGQLLLHRVTNSWGEGASNAGDPGGNGASAEPGDATWLHRSYPNSLWTNIGGDFVAIASGTIAITGVGPVQWASSSGLVTDVQAWVAAPAGNFGWLIESTSGESNSARRLDSRENSIDANRPRLTVQYSLCSAPVISVQPENTVTCAGTEARFTADASGSPSVRWQVADAASPGGWRDLIDGALFLNGNGQQYPVASVIGSDTTMLRLNPDFYAERPYPTVQVPVLLRMKASNACGSATTISASFTVLATSCSPADIASGDGEPLPPLAACDPNIFNPIGPDGGDFDCFFNYYFAASPDNAVCDIAYGDGEPMPPFGVSGGFNPGVDGGDFDCFFNYYFNGCL